MNSIEGLCKIDKSKFDCNSVIRALDRIVDRVKECNERIKKGEFTEAQTKSFLGFKFKSKRFNEKKCNEKFADIFDSGFAFLFSWDDEAPRCYASQKTDVLSAAARLMRLPGDVYLTSSQCSVVMSALGYE